jgi:hypothetical protein
MRYIICNARRFRDRETIVAAAGNFVNAGQKMNPKGSVSRCAGLYDIDRFKSRRWSAH